MSDQRELHKKKQLFQEELEELREQAYISQSLYDSVEDAYLRLYKKKLTLQSDEAQKESQPVSLQAEPNQEPLVPIEEPEERPQPVPPKEKPAPKKVKKEKTPEQIRERNITWSLILGVVLLLIGGLVVATSTWNQIGDVLKVGMLAFVSLFFYGLSWGGGRLLHIKQTSFAFLTLGSLFIPIAFVSIGYFELLGPYLSLYGEGREWLGLLCTVIALPIYATIAYRLSSRLYTWFTYLVSTSLVAFFLAGMNLSVDAFYLGIMIYNALLLIVYHRLQHNQRVRIFTKELPPYAQLNLIVSTLLMLYFYESDVFYSFNLLLTAVVYMSMVYVYKTKEYQFVFNILIAYGLYQLIEHTTLQQLDLVLFASVSFIYVALQYVLKQDSFMQNVFQYTAAVVSFLAFIYVSLEGIFLRTEEPSWLLWFAYLIIAFNYGYLTYQTRHLLFSFLTVIFVLVSGAQSWQLIESPWINHHFGLYMFLVSTIVYAVLWVYNRHPYTEPLRVSALAFTHVTMLLAIAYGAVTHPSGYEGSLMLLLFSGILFVTWRTMTTSSVQEAATWGVPLSAALGILALQPYMEKRFAGYDDSLLIHFAGTCLILLALSYIWKRNSFVDFAKSFFLVGVGGYTSMLFLLLSGEYPIQADSIPAILFAIGAGVYIILYLEYRSSWIWWPVSLSSLLFYYSLLLPLPIDRMDTALAAFILGAPAFLILLATWVNTHFRDGRQAFYVLAHIIQPFLLIGSVLFYFLSQSFSPFVLFIPLGVYMYSTWKAKYKMSQHLFLYTALSMILVLTTSLMLEFDAFQYVDHSLIFVISSTIMLGVYIAFSSEWQRRMEWYIIPFSLFGLFVFIQGNDSYQLREIPIMIVYVLFNLWLLHVRKWTLLAVIPLAISMMMWVRMGVIVDDSTLLILLVIGAITLATAGRVLFQHLYEYAEETVILDWYSIFASFYLALMYFFIDAASSIWLIITPLLLFSLLLYTQTSRMKGIGGKKTVFTIALVSLYAPYYLVVQEYKAFIPDIVHAEVIALPLLLYVIGFRFTTWKAYQKVMYLTQIGVLTLITMFVVGDAFLSGDQWNILVMGVLFAGLAILGRVLQYDAYVEKEGMAYVDLYSIASLAYWASLFLWIDLDSILWLKLMPFIGFTSFLLFQKDRFHQELEEKGMTTLIALSLLAPYYVVIEEYYASIPELVQGELLALPWLGIAIGLSLKTWRAYGQIMYHIQSVVLLLVTTYLLVDALASNTIWDAIIMGSLSLISIIAGMQLRIKSYFVVGIAVLVLNVFLQTRPFWGNMPWWAYLIIAGSILIAVASYNEWQKQRNDQDGKPLLQMKMKRLILKFKEWN